MRVAKQVKLWVILGLVLVLLLAGCAKAAPTPTPTPAPTPSPAPAPTPAPTPTATPTPSGPYGELRIAVSGSTWEFDPILGSVGQGTGLAPVCDMLIRLDDKGALAPTGILEKWEVAADGLSWTYYIRKGIKFQNGEDLTADDVKFSFDRYLSDKALSSLIIKSSVERVEKVDDYTVRLFTKGTQPFLPYYSAGYSPSAAAVTPKDYFGQVGAEYFGRHPVGAGPFKFVRVVPGDMLEYEAVDQHWRQVPGFKKVTEIAMPELSTRLAALKTKAVDITVIDVESADEIEARGFRLLTMLPDQQSVAFYATNDPRAAGMPTTDVKVRQALSLAINRDEINKTLFRGKGFPIMPPYVFQGSIDVDYDYWKDYMAKVCRYDPEEAKRLLKEAGYPQGFALKLLSGDRGRGVPIPKLVEIIQGYWLRIGVKAEIVPVDYSGVIIGQMYRGIDRTYAAHIGYAMPFPVQAAPITPVRLRAGFHSTGSLFLLGRSRPDVDKLIDDAQSSMDPAKRKELLAQVIKETVASYTFLSINAMAELVAVAPQVALNIPPGISVSMAPYLDSAKHRQP